jgi:hypothetical protein
MKVVWLSPYVSKNYQIGNPTNTKELKMETFEFTREDAEIHFNVTISESDWELVEEAISYHGDFNVEFTETIGQIKYRFDNSEVLDEIEYSSHEKIELSSELEKYTYMHWSDVFNAWETSIEIAVINAIKSELETLGLLKNPNSRLENDPEVRNDKHMSDTNPEFDPWSNQGDSPF